MNDKPDLELARAAQAGDDNAFAELVRRHHPKILGLCAALLSDRVEADDAAQEVFLKAYGALKSFQGTASFSTWLYRIASNQCLDILRSKARRKAESWDQLLEAEGPRLERLFAEPGLAQAAEDKDLVERVLARLSPEYRLVLILRETQGLTYAEIAAATGDTLDSVKARLRRARAELEEKLRHFMGAKNV